MARRKVHRRAAAVAFAALFAASLWVFGNDGLALIYNPVTGEKYCVSAFAYDHGIAESDWRYPLIGYFGSMWAYMAVALLCWGLFWIARRITRQTAQSG